MNYSPLEIIVIDDGSTDGSWEIIQSIAQQDKRFRIYRQPNKGVASACNLGLKEALGQWITFVDSDDVVLPWHLDILSNERSPSVDLLMTSTTTGLVDSNGIIRLRRCTANRRIISQNPAQYLFSEQYAPYSNSVCSVCNKLFLRSIITPNKITFDEDLSLGEGAAFLFKYLEFATALVHYTSSSYVIVDWPNISHLGQKLWSPQDYLYNQKQVYRSILNLAKLKDGDERQILNYSNYYGLDRPILRILLNYTSLKNKISEHELIEFTEAQVIPFLKSIGTISSKLSLMVRTILYVLFTFGAKLGLLLCSLYNYLCLFLWPLKKMKHLVKNLFIHNLSKL